MTRRVFCQGAFVVALLVILAMTTRLQTPIARDPEEMPFAPCR